MFWIALCPFPVTPAQLAVPGLMPAVHHHSLAQTDIDLAVKHFMTFIAYILPAAHTTRGISLLKVPSKRLFNDLTKVLFPTSSPAPTFPSPVDILGMMHLGVFLHIQGVTPTEPQVQPKQGCPYQGSPQNRSDLTACCSPGFSSWLARVCHLLNATSS